MESTTLIFVIIVIVMLLFLALLKSLFSRVKRLNERIDKLQSTLYERTTLTDYSYRGRYDKSRKHAMTDVIWKLLVHLDLELKTTPAQPSVVKLQLKSIYCNK